MQKIRRLSLLFILGTTLAAGTSFLSCTSSNEQPNIVWITSEDNSIHYLSLYQEGGAPTPHIAALAEHGLLFRNAFSNAPVCSVARSTIITGCYGPRIGSQYHRKIKAVPMPSGLEMFPAYLKSAGYYTTNCSKEDYNLVKSDSVWDASSPDATWKNRRLDQPFFHVHNIATTHESRLHFTEEEMQSTVVQTDTASFEVFPNHPDTELFRYTNAYYRDKVMQMDREVGTVVDELKAEGLLESTFIFYYGDHGGVLPGSKSHIYESGLHVPMVVHIPEKYEHLVDVRAGSDMDGFVSFVDLAPTVLNLAGIEIPEQMEGHPFMGEGVKSREVNSRNTVYGYADRFDEKYDFSRSVRKGHFKYIRNYHPFQCDGLRSNYRYRQLAYKEWLELSGSGALNDVQSQYFRPRPPEQLFDLKEDPHETCNLAGDPEYREVRNELREMLSDWITGMPDLSFYPEYHLIAHAFDNPVVFGLEHQEDIARYKYIADLQLRDLTEVREEILSHLDSEDPWDRYWALITCSSAGSSDKEIVERARNLSQHDPVPVNRVRAAEYLGLTGLEDPETVMLNTLYASEDAAEALLILNSIVLLQDGEKHYSFDIDPVNMKTNVRNNIQVSRRLEYLVP